MLPHERENLLFVDVETHETTLQVLSIQWRYRGEHGIITEFNDETFATLKALWDSASAVVAWNALFDMGALSVAYSQNQFDATKKPVPTPGRRSPGRNWKITVFGHYYHVKKVGGHHNIIKHYNRVDERDDEGKGIKSTPVIDLLKLWAILIDSKNLSLSAVSKRYLQRDLIPYSAEAALTDAYRYQDVDVLDELVDVFLEKTATIEDLNGYNCEMWSKIVSPATFVKIAYEREYPALRRNPNDGRSRSMREKNDARDRYYKLTRALEDAYFGGITVSFYRGTLDNAAWFDIKGAYSRAIQTLNTDQYLVYDWRAVPAPDRDKAVYNRDRPALCQVTTDAIMTSINKSLKIYRVEKPRTSWYWNFDVQTLRLLFPDCIMDIERVYEPIPLNPAETSLPGEWDRMKDEEQARNGKTTRREFFKLLSNTSYGIKAQREPRVTAHTNLCIAGMITARSHLALIEMADECQRHGLIWRYSDTDSVCVTGEYFDGLTDAINRRIAPFVAECEGYNERVMIFSLKRYIRRYGSNRPDVRLHGKGKYRLTPADFLAFIDGRRDNKPLLIGQMAATTPLTMRMLQRHFHLLNYSLAVENVFPFAFHTLLPTDLTVHDFMERWAEHIDTKTTAPKDTRLSAEFDRKFLSFHADEAARAYYDAIVSVEDDISDPAGTDITDDNIRVLFYTLFDKSD